MAKTFNTSPYFDDFDPAKHFYRVLFKPGYAVQARELNQVQSILQHQITAIGNHLFKKNAIVVPGNTILHPNADITSISTASLAGTTVTDLSYLVGKTLTNAPSFDYGDDTTLDGYITAVVLAVQNATTGVPAALYVKYFKTQKDGRIHFNKGETLYTVESTESQTTLSVDSTIGSTIGKVAVINSGTIYTRDTFVDVEHQTVIVEVSNDVVTNATIGLQIVESIVTSNEDSSLLDNATGYPNEYAPGADRYRIDLILTKLLANAYPDENQFITLMQIRNNEVVFNNNKTEYAELMKMIARRTYDTNGNFIVRGLETSAVESVDGTMVTATVSNGKCYLGGYEYEQIANTPISIAKPRDLDHQKQMPAVRTYASSMPFFYVAGSGSYPLKELPSPDSLVQLLDRAPSASGALVVGYGIIKHLQYYTGTVGDNDVYKLFFEYISLNKGYTIDDVYGYRNPVATSFNIGGVEGGAFLQRLDLISVNGSFSKGDTVISGSDASLTSYCYYYGNDILFLVRNTSAKVPKALMSVVKTGTNNAVIATAFLTNYTDNFVPVIQLDNSPIKTLYTTADGTLYTNKTSYTSIYTYEGTTTSGGTFVSPTLSGDETFADPSQSNYAAFVRTNSPTSENTAVTDALTVSLSSNGKVFTISQLPASEQVIIYATVLRTNAAEAKKTSTSATTQITMPSKSWMPLLHQDVISLTKVTEGKIVHVSDATWTSNQATLTLEYTVATATQQYSIAAGDKVVVRNVKSSNNSDSSSSTFNMSSTGGVSGFNGIVTLISASSSSNNNDDGTKTVTVTITYATPASDPGTYIASDDDVVAIVPTSDDVEITSRYNFDAGHTAYWTGVGMVKLKPYQTNPIGQILVQYQYYSVSGTTGNYISVDSYGDYTGDLSYIGKIPHVTDDFGGHHYLNRCIDLRTRATPTFVKNLGAIASGSNLLKLKDLNLSSRLTSGFSYNGTGLYVVGPALNGATGTDHKAVVITSAFTDPTTGDTTLVLAANAGYTVTNGTYYIGLKGSDLSIVSTGVSGLADSRTFRYPKDSSAFTYEYTKFLPKHVMIYVDRKEDSLKLKYEEVQGLQDVLAQRRNEFKLPLTYMYFEPYTSNIQEVHLTKMDNPVYHMLDIHNLKLRIERNEYYTNLALNRDLSESASQAMENQTNSESRGFWNEDFMSPFTQDHASPDYACTVYDKSHVGPGVVTRVVDLAFDNTLNTSTWTQTGPAITLPYTESIAIYNDRASRVNNLNPFNTAQWNGKMVLNPSVDNWIDITASVTSTVKSTVTVAVPPPPPIIVNAPAGATVTVAPATVAAAAPKPAPPPPPPPPPPVVTIPPPVVPPPPVVEIVTEVNVQKAAWGPDTAGGKHAITFTWKTNLGKTGRVSTDIHNSSLISKHGYDGKFAKSLVGRKYNDADVKGYLSAGQLKKKGF